MANKINWRKALSVYFIAGTQDVAKGQFLTVLDEAIQGGITCFQLREKGETALQKAEAIKALAKECQERCHKAGIPFIINDDISLAIDIGADAVHVGQGDKEIHETIQAVKPLGIEVGLSINTLAQLNIAQQIKGLDYIGVGPVFVTHSKVDAQAVVGLDLVKQAVEQTSLSTVAIGGINLGNVEAVRATGVDGVAVISAIAASREIGETVRKLGGIK